MYILSSNSFIHQTKYFGSRGTYILSILCFFLSLFLWKKIIHLRNKINWNVMLEILLASLFKNGLNLKFSQNITLLMKKCIHIIERIFPCKADSWNVYSKHHDSQYLHYFRYKFYSKFSWNNAEEMRTLSWKKTLLEVHFILHVQTNTSNITWTSKSFL